MLLTCFIMLISGTFFGLFTHAIGTITLLTTPSLLCEQDVVEFNCTLSSGITYTGSVASLSINGSTSCFTGPSIFNGAVPRLSFTSIGGTATAPAAQYTISPFLRQDNATRYRCCADNSASPFNTEFTSNLSLSLAAPPSSAANISISSTYDSATSCTGTIALTWPAVASDRAVTSYEVLLNDTVDGTVGTTTFTTGSLNLLEHYANYTVVATSCAGSSMASYPAMFTALTPGPPSSSAFMTVLTNLTDDCVAQLNISLNITSNRVIIYYLLHINNQLEENATASGNNYVYSSILQLKVYKTNKLNVNIAAHSCAGSTSESATVYGRCDFSKGGLSTGAIVGIAVGAACFIIIAIAVMLLCCILIYFAIKRKARSDQEERKK